MNKPHGIIVFGANGSGKTTLGRELADILNFKHMDIEDYYFEKSEIPYTMSRSREDCLNLMLSDIEKHRSFVLSAVTGDFGDIIPQFYELAVFISAPVELRIERIKKRAYKQHRERVCESGDMYEQHLTFVDFAASRPLSKIDEWAETLTCPVMCIDGAEDWGINAKNIAERFYEENVRRFAESELQVMRIQCKKLSLIRNKDGVSVWRVISHDNSFVMKCFEKPEYRREITNYQILISLGIPTVNVIAHTDYSILMEDVNHSTYRLGTDEDINNPKIAVLIAAWYKTLHTNGREYANANSLYDECDCLTLENIRMIQEKTSTGSLPVWKIIENNFFEIQSAAIHLPRTLTYNDFHYTNLIVARNETSAIIIDYNMLGKGYVYSDIRNVCSQLGNEETIAAFRLEYGDFNENEKLVDDVICPLISLHTACSRKIFPAWGNEPLDMVKDGRLLSAVEKLIFDLS